MAPSRMTLLALTTLGLMAVGCTRNPSANSAAIAQPETPAAEGPEYAVKLPPPAPEQIEYDKAARTIMLYQLPGTGRWHVLVPGNPNPTPAVGRHRLPVGVDPDRTFVFYVTTDGHQSQAVTLRDIERAQGTSHSSQVR
ncbi:MAG: hypothetical protein K2P78_05890 [Gemmataceae bacterium]|nr:hypothetical protein [Gemmataceae bacterium]